MYICHKARLENYLMLPKIRAFLARFGYSYASIEEALQQLKDRMNGELSHEIGVFLGYPLCDVRLFARSVRLCFCAARGRCMKMPTKRRACSSGSAVVLPASAGIWTEEGL